MSGKHQRKEDEYRRLPHKLKDPAGPRSAYNEIKRSATTAVAEHLYHMTLGLQLPPAPSWRSALYASLDGHHFIITASHDLEESKIKEVHAVPRPRGPIRQVGNPKMEIVPTPSPGREMRVSLEALRFTPANPLDLLVLKVKPLPDNGGYLFPFDLGAWKPSRLRVEHDVLIIGFPEDYARITQEAGWPRPRRRLAMYLHMTERGQPSETILNFDPKFHIVLNQNSKRFSAMRIGPKGLSGGSVWRMRRIRHKKEIWSPTDAELIGIQSAVYSTSRLLKVTRIQYAIEMAREMSGIS